MGGEVSDSNRIEQERVGLAAKHMQRVHVADSKHENPYKQGKLLCVSFCHLNQPDL